MKSERAKLKLEYYSEFGRCIDGLTEAECERVAEIAEEDAQMREREEANGRAIKALCRMYCNSDCGICSEYTPYGCHDIKEFLKHYDNEK